ncbi:MAG: GPR endopeptidase [Bacillota bacterium]|nr:GPR endopeptidase [Bacillota bacterium]
MGIRTDLALESKEIFEEGRSGDAGEIPGVAVDVDQWDQDIRVTRIRIQDEEGAAALGKPPGNYITIELEAGLSGTEARREEAARAVAAELKKLLPQRDGESPLQVLVVGLGNPEVTPDALGPRAAGSVQVTRHIFLLFREQAEEGMACVSVLCPGVMASTGMETAELIRKAVEIAGPDLVLAVDALAAREASRINTTIQISDTGISPGAGTGNMRKELTEKSLGRKVLAVGVPTVIDSNTLIMDSLGGFLTEPEKAEQYLAEQGASVIVTSSDIDQVVAGFSEILANAINITLHPGIYS